MFSAKPAHTGRIGRRGSIPERGTPPARTGRPASIPIHHARATPVVLCSGTSLPSPIHVSARNGNPAR
ncbi:MAG: hypothetical protein KIS87_07175 [Phycisphaeraceae bacterium]|nr:hypothetical protein [Phycisphaeraceae bacterium]